MLQLVRIALQRPLTFIVMAVLIVLIGPLAAMRTPTDILPDINIPVIAVVWQYQGLPAQDMAGRIIYYYERTLTSTVNNIEHIESQSLNGVGVVKIFFQPGVNISTASAQVTSISQTVLKQMPPGITPPQVLNYSASTVPILELAFSSKTLGEGQIYDTAQNFIRPALATVPGAATPSPYGGKVRQIQIDLNPTALQAKGLSPADVGSALANQNLIIPAGTAKIGQFEYDVELNDSPQAFAELIHHPNGVPFAGRVRTGFESIVRDAGLDGKITPHWMRHTAATWMMEGGVDVWQAAGYLGMTPSTLEKHYGHHRTTHQSAARSVHSRR